MKREQTTIRLPTELKDKVQRQADKMGISFNEFIMTAIDSFLNHRK